MTSRPFKRGSFESLPEKPRRPHRYFESEARELEVESPDLGCSRVHIHVAGSGPPLLLVHGLMTSSYSWRYALEPLGEHFKCFAPDLPGNGASEGPLEPAYSPLALARWLGAVQRALGIRGCPVVGNSMGGYIGMVWALDDPDAMSRLVNIHSPGCPDWRLHAARLGLSLPGIPAGLRWLIRRDPERWAHRHVHYYDESLKSREEARHYGAPLATRAGAQALIKYLSETMGPRHVAEFQAQLGRRKRAGEPFPVPLLLLYAREDPMVPPDTGSRLAEAIIGARLEWLERASHFAHVDAVEAFTAHALPFLRGGS